MSKEKIITAVWVSAFLIGACALPDHTLAIGAWVALILFGFLEWLERRELKGLEAFKAEIAKIKSDIEDINLKRGLGR